MPQLPERRTSGNGRREFEVRDMESQARRAEEGAISTMKRSAHVAVAFLESVLGHMVSCKPTGVFLQELSAGTSQLGLRTGSRT